MKLNDVLESEKVRKEKESWNKVLLRKEGAFYHAYEWSAWLIKCFVLTEEFQKERGDEKMLSAFKYTTKHAEYVMLGFPVESISKYIPTYENINPLDNNDLEIEVSLPYTEEATYETLEEDYKAWWATCAANEDKKQKKANVQQISNAAEISRSGLFSILTQVMSYPIEKSTPADNINFIGRLKQQVAAML
jgi:hypothetical protein